MRGVIILFCLAGLALASCNKEAEDTATPAQNQAGAAAANEAGNDRLGNDTSGAAWAGDDEDDNAGIVMTCDDDDEDGPIDAIAPGERNAAWAVPIPGIDALPNFHRVSDQLYRGAQPTSAEGFRFLEDMGIKTVVNLRWLHSDRSMLRGTGLAYESIRMKAWHAEDEDIVRFLQIVTDPARQPVFVHCQHGADRTGTMCAIYRVVVQGWDKEDAVREMRYGGFGFHEIWTGLPKYIRALDVQTIRQNVDIPEE